MRELAEALAICRKAMPDQGFADGDVHSNGGGHFTAEKVDAKRAKPTAAVCRTFLGELDTTYFYRIPPERLLTTEERNLRAALAVCHRAMPEQELELKDVHKLPSGDFEAFRTQSEAHQVRVCRTRGGLLDTTFYREKP